MKKVLLLIFLIFPFLLCGCGKKEEILLYAGCSKISTGILNDFEKLFNVDITLNTYETDEEGYQKIVDGQVIYDIALMPDYQTERLIDDDLVQVISYNRNNVDEEYITMANMNSVPFLAGTLGILYDGSKLQYPMWGKLWDTNFFYDTIMTANMRDAIAIGLKVYNYDINSKNPYEIDKVRVRLTDQQRFILSYQTFQAKVNIAEGRAAYGVVYSGEAFNAINASYKTVENLKYSIPEEGSRKFVDCLIIPKNSERNNNAQKLLEYLLRADVQAKNAEATGYAPTALGAKELMPDELQNNEIIFGNQSCKYFDYNKTAYELYTKAWQAVRKR